MIEINRQAVLYQGNETLLNLLHRPDYSPDFVAVEVNGQLIKRKKTLKAL